MFYPLFRFLGLQNDSQDFSMRAMRSRLMAYTKGLEGGRPLRESLGRVTTLEQLVLIARQHLQATHANLPQNFPRGSSPAPYA